MSKERVRSSEELWIPMKEQSTSDRKALLCTGGMMF